MEAYDEEKRKYELRGSASEGGVKEIVLSMDEKPVFTLHIGDQLKGDAKDSIEYLRKRDIEPIIVSGDKESIVAKTASTLNIVKYHAEQLPEQKLALLTKYQGIGKTGLIGDGINDAAAIAQANVGFAFTDTSHLNLDSADVVLLSGELSGLTKALMVSKQTYKTIKQNLFWAFSYNIIAIPLAAVGLVNPIAGVAFMAFSDLLVIGNALLLRGRLNRGLKRTIQDSED
jgi:Cu+-exporting ATPase